MALETDIVIAGGTGVGLTDVNLRTVAVDGGGNGGDVRVSGDSGTISLVGSRLQTLSAGTVDAGGIRIRGETVALEEGTQISAATRSFCWWLGRPTGLSAPSYEEPGNVCGAGWLRARARTVDTSGSAPRQLNKSCFVNPPSTRSAASSYGGIASASRPPA